MQVAQSPKTSAHVFAEQTETLAEFWPEVFAKVPGGAGQWWLVSRPLAQAVEGVGQVVVTDGWSDWWYVQEGRPEDSMGVLGLAEFLA